eukprot:6063_1
MSLQSTDINLRILEMNSRLSELSDFELEESVETKQKLKSEIFKPQKLVTYEEAMDMLLNIHCCFGVYDKKVKRWRTVVFHEKWDNYNGSGVLRLQIRFTDAQRFSVNQSLTIQDFPVNYIILNDTQRFSVKEYDLRDLSNLSNKQINLWIKRCNQKRCDMTVIGFINGQQKSGQIPVIPSDLKQIIVYYYFRLMYAFLDLFHELFDKMDPDNNEDIDEKEWIQGLRNLNVHITESDMAKLFKLMDGDRSGYIDRRDWITFCMTSYSNKELQRLHDSVLNNIKEQ